jgi:hypothetical protein
VNVGIVDDGCDAERCRDAIDREAKRYTRDRRKPCTPSALKRPARYAMFSPGVISISALVAAKARRVERGMIYTAART